MSTLASARETPRDHPGPMVPQSQEALLPCPWSPPQSSLVPSLGNWGLDAENSEGTPVPRQTAPSAQTADGSSPRGAVSNLGKWVPGESPGWEGGVLQAREAPGKKTRGPVAELCPHVEGSATRLCLLDAGMSRRGHSHCLPAMTRSLPQAGPPDPLPGCGSTGGILQGAGRHCFRQVPPTGSSPGSLLTSRRACLSQEHDGRGGSCPHLFPGAACRLAQPPPLSSQGEGLAPSLPLEARALAPRLPQGDLALLATPGWA